MLKKNLYILYMLDLDTCNPLEREEGSKIEGYKFIKIFEYGTEEVNYKTLDCIFVRGSSRKERI